MTMNLVMLLPTQIGYNFLINCLFTFTLRIGFLVAIIAYISASCKGHFDVGANFQRLLAENFADFYFNKLRF